MTDRRRDSAAADTEAEPLLQNEDRDDSTRREGKVSLFPRFKEFFVTVKTQLVDNWAVWRVLIVMTIMAMIQIVSAAEGLDLARALACAQYYDENPDDAAEASARGLSAEEMCSLDIIEDRSNFNVTLIDSAGAVFAILSMFYINPRIRKFGCKHLLYVSLSLPIIKNLASILLPRGYPNGPKTSEMPISPTSAMHLYVAISVFSAILGQDSISMCCLRIMTVDASTISSKSGNLQLLFFFYLGGMTLGPALSSLASSFLPIYVGNVVHLLYGAWQALTSILLGRNVREVAKSISASTADLPTSNEYSNVTPFILGILCSAVAVIFIMVSFPDDRRVEPAASGQQGHTAGDDLRDRTRVQKQAKPFVLTYLVPKRTKAGSKDYRIPTVVCVVFLHWCAGYTINVWVQYFGHALHWKPESVSYLISFVGGSRILTLIAFVPLVLKYYERHAKRPALLRGMTVEEIKAHGAHMRADETPADDAAQADAESSRVHIEQDRDLDGAVAIWRARVDRSLLKVSWILDALGWLVVASSTLSPQSTAVNLAGSLFVAFGSGAPGARMSIDLAIIGDVLANEEHAHRVDGGDHSIAAQSDATSTRANLSHAGASELYFSLQTITECAAMLTGPWVSSAIYRSTLSSFPAANWLWPSSLFVLCIILHFSMTVYK